MGFSWKTGPIGAQCIIMSTYEILIDGKAHKIGVTKTSEKAFTVTFDGKPVNVTLQADKLDFEKPFPLMISGKSFRVSLQRIDVEKPFGIKVEEVSFMAEVKPPAAEKAVTAFVPKSLTPATRRGIIQREIVEGAVTAPMTGKIISVKVRKGDSVKQGQVVCIVEAMKMENEITAPKAGTVQEITVLEGSSVNEGQTLLLIG